MIDILIGILIGAGAVLSLVGVGLYLFIRWIKKQEGPLEIKWDKNDEA